jgi:peptidoglycan hydrolase-like protein with peptidoglycan-binding domain
MCEKCRQQQMELLPEFESLFNEWEGELYPEMEFETGSGFASAPGTVNRNGPAYIKWLQRALTQAGSLQVPETGRMTSYTRRSLIYFQRRHGLVADGIPGPKTELKLILAGADCCPPKQ